MNSPSKYVEVLGNKMHFVEMGSGRPIVFLHGIPTSSYLWRKVMPHLAQLGRCIAPDLIGFGASDQADIDYSVQEHIRYVEKFIEALNLKNIILVMHGYGSILGFNYAMCHEKNCKGLVFYEAFLRSLNKNDISLPFQEQLAAWQNAEYLDTISNGTTFIDTLLPQMIMRSLTDEEMQSYRKPFDPAKKNIAIEKYCKEVSEAKSANNLNEIIAIYTQFLCSSQLPKLMLYSLPGFITSIASVMWAKEHLANLEIIDLGEELHLAQESCPELMGEAISIWLQGIEQR